MPFQVIHPRSFAEQFGVKTPSRATLKRWRDAHGFPESLNIPRGYYRLDEVAQWFEARTKRSEHEQAA